MLDNLMRPIRAFRWAYLPLVMVYFAYGALGLIDVSRDFWIKETLTRVGFEAFSSSPEELRGFVKVQLAKWKKMVDDAGIQPE